MYHSEFGEGIILSGFPEELKQDPNHPDYANVTELTVKVDYYRYQNYIMSYMPESYYGIIDSNASGGLYQDPLGPVRKTRTKEEFEDLMKRNVIIDILDIKSSPNSRSRQPFSINMKLKNIGMAHYNKVQKYLFLV